MLRHSRCIAEICYALRIFVAEIHQTKRIGLSRSTSASKVLMSEARSRAVGCRAAVWVEQFNPTMVFVFSHPRSLAVSLDG